MLAEEVRRRRTFAIISHPDAGKTTLTEKLLLYAGAIREAGAVRAAHRARTTISDWMALERQRGISISATAIRFDYGGCVFNLLDTPGHADFSADAYRALYAADSAVLLLDAAKGVEPQTLKLFQVARSRALPLVVFVNKCDRPSLPPLELLERLERELGVAPVPLTWPIGDGGSFRGVIDAGRQDVVLFARVPHGATPVDEQRMPLAAAPPSPAFASAREELALALTGAAFDRAAFLSGAQAPVLFGSAAANFGVRLLLGALADLAPAPAAKPTADGRSARPLDAPFSAFVFKVQANMDPRHRDRAAFLRVCSGHFERGMRARVARTGRELQLKYVHQLFGRERTTADGAVAGDVVAVAGGGDLRIGDTLFSGPATSFAPPPLFPPERFALVRQRDLARYKQFRRGLAHLDEEGVVQVFRRHGATATEAVLAAVGELQLEVARFRLEEEFGVGVELEPAPWRALRAVAHTDAARLAGRWGVEVVEDRAGRSFVVGVSEHVIDSLLDRRTAGVS